MTLLALDWAFILEKLLLIAVVITISLVVAMYATYVERKFAGFIQGQAYQTGPVWFGLLQPLTGNWFFKEEIIPNNSNKLLFILDPCPAMLTAMMTSAVIPWGSTVELFKSR